MAIPVLAITNKLLQTCQGKGDPCAWRGAWCAVSPRAELGLAVELWQQGGVRNSPLSPTNSATSFEWVRGSRLNKFKYWEREWNCITCQKYLTPSNGFFTQLTVVPGSIRHWSRRTPCLEDITIWADRRGKGLSIQAKWQHDGVLMSPGTNWNYWSPYTLYHVAIEENKVEILFHQFV